MSLTLSLVGSLAHLPSASAAGDPVARGSFTLALSKGFERQLKREGVKVNGRKLKVRKGRVDPIRGSASLALGGKLTFRRGGRKAVLRKMTVALGRRGTLRSGGLTLLKLRGGSVRRRGFGARIRGIRARLPRRAARKLNHRLGLGSLRPGGAGKASILERPRTVRVIGGETSLTPVFGTGRDVAFKLFDHCVDPLSGVEAVAPAYESASFSFVYPIVGGTVGPTGGHGLVLHAGSLRVSKDPTEVSGVCGGVPTGASVLQRDLQLDLAGNRGFADSSILGYPPPLGGDKGVAIVGKVGRNRSVTANPKNGKITITGVELSLSQASALFLNLVFPNSSGNPSRDFRAGDVLGIATTTVRTR